MKEATANENKLISVAFQRMLSNPADHSIGLVLDNRNEEGVYKLIGRSFFWQGRSTELSAPQL